MVAWSWVVTPGVSGGRELTAARTRKVTFRRQAAATAEFTIDGRHEEALEVEETVSDLTIFRAGTRLFRGRFGWAEDTLDENHHAVKFSVPDYRGRLASRLLYAGDALGPYAGTDAGTLASTIVGIVQGRTNGDEGITAGVGIPAGIVAPTTTFVAGNNAAQSIDLFAKSSAAPFDWEIAADLKLNVYPGARGSTPGVLLDYGGAVTKVTRTLDPSKYANALRMSGSTAAGSVEVAAADVGTRTEGRWEKQVADTNIATAGLLADRAAGELSTAEVILPAYKLTLAPEWWTGPAHVWLGDIVDVQITSGRLSVLDGLRVEEIMLEPTEDGLEKVTLTVGTVFHGNSEWASIIERRLRDVERR